MSIGGTELKLYADNDAKLSRMRMAIAKNLATKRARGTYDNDQALRAWMHLANAAAKAYVKEFGAKSDKWSTIFPIVDRRSASFEWQTWWRSEAELGNFESLLPAKYQRSATRKKSAEAFQQLGETARSSMKEQRSTARKQRFADWLAAAGRSADAEDPSLYDAYRHGDDPGDYKRLRFGK